MEFRKKMMMIPILALLLVSVPMVLAIDIDIDSDDPVAVETLAATISWDGSGFVDIDAMVNDDASVDFFTGGDSISGSLYLKDYGTGMYDVNTFTTNVNAYVEDGYIQYGIDRLDSGPYGPADQSAYSYVGATGSASMTYTVITNYASLYSASYSNNFAADAGEGTYFAEHRTDNGDNNAYFLAGGTGVLDVDHAIDGYTTHSSIGFGRGCGCYTKANVEQTGSGSFVVGGYFENTVSGGYDGIHDKTPSWTASGPVTYLQSFSFSDGFSWTDYSFDGN
uniref:Uncharacterized protein n=1 Tax=viral metagenome TaxID=1070528 RepID=A0A6M3LXF0_9ZZZZ